ncbi:Alginate biosynthesis protein AlgA [Actinomadura rubteroloni]|uniref:Alginate biosynthesis protein AlgA n=1 Tax=Actinomadura rubteroloni TaxID=1926885 RepID=A0A2P4UNJ1_9ACTN|nr:sugar phosphate nucleotidyltransferase [Actinomadura rubteroloni]POM26617.1 Alginate biosynthesis protein AlgA [Actinomadura rubteroloni]
MTVHVVVLAGGAGTRLWPLSRAHRPKFLLDPGTGQPPLANALARAVQLADPEHVRIVTGRAHAADVRAVAAPFGVTRVLVEPLARDTAAAVAFGVASVDDPGAIVVSMPADQLVASGAQTWRDVLGEAVRAAAGGALVCVGVVPDRPATAYGYAHAPAGTGDGARPVAAFHEKPDAATAASYLAAGGFYWNTAIMAFRAATFAGLVRDHAPSLVPVLSGATTWDDLPRVAVEPAVVEPAAADGRVLLVPARLRWNDIGSWTDFPGASGGVVAVDADGCRVLSGDRRYALLGVRDLLVVDAGDVVLVADRARDQDLRRLVGEVAARWPDLL